MSYGMRRTDACQWTATTTHGIDTVDLTVKGVCQEPTPGFKDKSWLLRSPEQHRHLDCLGPDSVYSRSAGGRLRYTQKTHLRYASCRHWSGPEVLRDALTAPDQNDPYRLPDR
jgi:hypothetical protein